MNVALRKPMTVAEFLAWEEQQQLRYEFDGAQVYAMTGGTYAHDALQVAIIRALENRLAGTPCRAHGSNLKIEVMGSVRYPDAFVTCGPIRRDSTVAPDPLVIFEVLSASTGVIDAGVKNREYAGTSSVRRYVMVEQFEVAGTMFERIGEDWVGHLLTARSIIGMPEIGIEIPVAEFYERLDMTDATKG